MDVVTQTGTIRCWIVCSENLDVGPATGGSLKYQGDQVGLRQVILSKLSVSIRSCGVEVPQRQVLQAMRFVKPPHRPLEREFRFVVWIDWILRMIFTDWNI